MQPHPEVLAPKRKPARPRRATSRQAVRDRARPQTAARGRRPLARYVDANGRPREILLRPGAHGTSLVIDRDADTHGGCRLLAHLFAEEPAENAARVCADYLERTFTLGCRCRPLLDADAHALPLAEQPEAAGCATAGEAAPVDRHGHAYALRPTRARMSIPELRWCRDAGDEQGVLEPLSMREAIGSLESYEPVRSLTVRMIAAHRHDDGLSTTVLRGELTRVQESPIVLNRALREAVVAAVEREELSMSEIAIRCGRVKRDRSGKESGETSWLGRRLGLLPEGGQSRPTPWIHSDVLGLIARNGLGISPREVELG